MNSYYVPALSHAEMLLLNACGHCLSGNAFWEFFRDCLNRIYLKEILLNKWDFRPTAASTSLRLIVGNLIYSDRSLPALFFVRIPTVFQHCMRAPLLCSSTFLHAFLLFLSTFLCAHPYCTPARPRAENNPIWVHYACIAIAILLPLALFFVRIPTVFQHGLRALLLCSST